MLSRLKLLANELGWPRISGVTLRAAFAAALLFGLLSSALAQEQKARELCAADYRQYCAGVSPGGGRVRACMTENFDKLSADCKRVLSARQQK